MFATWYDPEFRLGKLGLCCDHSDFFFLFDLKDAFSKAVAEFLSKRSKYDIINAHDWHAALVGYYLNEESIWLTDEYRQRKRIVFTINNAGYQGIFDKEKVGAGRPWDGFYFRPDGFEFHGRFNFMKAGIHEADAVLTVAPSYGLELLTERFGFGLDGFLARAAKEKPFAAILNGVDLQGWRPPFEAGDFSKKLELKVAVQKKYGLKIDPAAPLIVMTSRLADQKGIHYWPNALGDSLRRHPRMQAIVVADGEAWVSEELRRLSDAHPGRLVAMPFDSNIEREVTWAADFFVNVPWYEPSGTNQLFAMASGTVPMLSRVGGLQDYVQDGQNGILIDIHFKGSGSDVDLGQTRASVVSGFDRLNACFADTDCLNRLRVGAMSSDYSWSAVTQKYQGLFSTVQARPWYRGLPGASCMKSAELLLTF